MNTSKRHKNNLEAYDFVVSILTHGGENIIAISNALNIIYYCMHAGDPVDLATVYTQGLDAFNTCGR